MLRSASQVRSLRTADRDEALDLCARDPAANVYVAARILETDLDRGSGSLLGYYPGRRLEALCWVASNVVPVGGDEAATRAFAERLRRQRSRTSSIFGPADQVGQLWEQLRQPWGAPLDVRANQPLMMVAPDQPITVAGDERVRLATADDVPLVVPAAAAMFTEEIGYPPYADRVSHSGYWSSVRALVARGHTFVVIENGRLVFKADLGSVAVGACQVQGVWVDPGYRRRGLSAPAMAAVVELARRDVAPLVTLYVNDYNTAALAAYRRVGFVQMGVFTTILV
ncbi:MAG TPA: GNAT family N-acetyltransferase [Dermatophilaceae bacterium]|nr:GNAT family N-acetyltransferase [Dermatophilaceae bacterium]